MKKYIGFLCLSLLLISCAAQRRTIDLAGFGYELAILPMANETTNLDGPVVLRKALYKKLTHRGYSVMPLEETDSLLNEMGITDGGQLNALPVKEISEKLQARRLVYTNLITFKPLRIALFEVIKLNIRMFDGKSETLIWETDQGVFGQKRKNKESSWDGHLKSLVGAALVEKVVRAPLYAEVDKITNIIVRKINRIF
jgi:hypothetical protein